MRKLLYILISILILSFVMSCGRSADRRLVLADTLMWTNPDSSLIILQGINRDSLQGDENKAYYALLLTQAQFRCNIPLTGDTLISKAVEYYSDNHNREHYTRSLLYKGGAFEDMGDPIEAIKWYKQAEDNADTTDYRNLAQINFRMGMLYYNNYAGNNLDLEKFKKAFHYYNIIQDQRMTMLCNSYLGNIYRFKDQSKAKFHLLKAIEEAKVIGDSSEYYECMTSLALSHFYDKDYIMAKDIAIYCINNGVNYINDNCYYNAARAFCALDNLDSANYYFSKTNKNTNDKQLLAVRYLTQTEISALSDDKANYKKYISLYNNLCDSVSKSSTLDDLIKKEWVYTENTKKNVVKQFQNHKYSTRFIYSLLIIIICIILFFMVRKRQNTKALKEMMFALKTNYDQEHANQIQLLNTISLLQDKITENRGAKKQMYINETQNTYLKDVVAHHIEIMDKLLEASERDSDKKFKELFNSIISEYKNNDHYWNAMFQFVNDNYKGFINKIKRLYPSINDKYLKITILNCLGFDYIDCAIIMGTTTKTMATIFSRIAKKIGTNKSLPKVVYELKAECLNGPESI